MEANETDSEWAQTETAKAGSVKRLVRRFAYRSHPNERLRKYLPDEIQVGWEFEDAIGKKCFLKWGSTRNKESLRLLIADVQSHEPQPIEVVDLDAQNDKLTGAEEGKL